MEINMDRAEIQVQISGNWQTYCSTLNDPQYILNEMKNAKYPMDKKLIQNALNFVEKYRYK